MKNKITRLSLAAVLVVTGFSTFLTKPAQLATAGESTPPEQNQDLSFFQESKFTEENQKRLFEAQAPQSEVKDLAEFLGLEYPHIFTEGKLTLEEINEYVGKSNIAPAGEGVVLKNPNFKNSFGDHVYAKVVHQKFKEANAIVFGGNNKHSDTYWEMYVVNKYCTVGRVQKNLQKLQSASERRLGMEDTPRVGMTCYHDMITEEIWDIAKKVPELNFKALQRLSIKKFIQIYHDILNNSLSIADKEQL